MFSGQGKLVPSFLQELLNSSKLWQPALWTLHISFYPELWGHNQTPRTTHIASGLSVSLSTHKIKDNSFTGQQRMLSLHCSRKMYSLLFTQKCPVRVRQVSLQHGTKKEHIFFPTQVFSSHKRYGEQNCKHPQASIPLLLSYQLYSRPDPWDRTQFCAISFSTQ